MNNFEFDMEFKYIYKLYPKRNFKKDRKQGKNT